MNNLYQTRIQSRKRVKEVRLKIFNDKWNKRIKEIGQKQRFEQDKIWKEEFEIKIQNRSKIRKLWDKIIGNTYTYRSPYMDA